MFNKKEIINLLVVIVVLSFSVTLFGNLNLFPYVLLSVFLIVSLNSLAKKITSYYVDSEIDIRIWKVYQYGFKPKKHFKKPILAGLIFPIIISIITFGYVKWLGSLVFEVQPKVYRAAKKYGLYRFSEMTEAHIGLIAASGIVVNLFFAILGYLIGIPSEMNFVRLSVFYAFFNMLPVSSLDGNKIFFGSVVLWSFLASITLIAMAYAFLLI